MMTRYKIEWREICGWLALDKPSGISSAQALTRVKRAYRARRLGHAGTLDPLASGVLPLAFGDATKTIQFMNNADKEYIFTVRWGLQTDSDDREGKIIKRSPNRPTRVALETACSHFTGEIYQTPPSFSALKIDGERAYKRARKGEMPIMTPRHVHIDALALIDMPDRDHARFNLICQKGVYVRAIARDLGTMLGTYGHVSALRRTRVGKFSEKDAITLEKIFDLVHSAPAPTKIDALIMPLATVLDDILVLAVSDHEADFLRYGRAFSVMDRIDIDSTADTPAYAHMRNIPIALGHIEGGVFYPRRVFSRDCA